MEAFFERQLDYLIFSYGMAYFVLAISCYIAGRRRGDILPWKWLFFFSFTHGFYVWLKLVEISHVPWPILNSLRFTSLIFSFAFLLKFGIAGTFPRSKVLRRLPEIIAVMLLAAMPLNMPGAFAISRYSLGLSGGLWTAGALFSAARKINSLQLRYASGLMFGYALQAGTIVPPAPFSPASIVNDNTFINAVMFPVQLFSGITVLALSLSILLFIRRGVDDSVPEPSFHVARQPLLIAKPLAALLALLLAGFILTTYIGRYAETSADKSLLNRALTIAASINPERVANLKGVPADEDNPDFIRIKEQLQMVKSANPDCRSVYLMGIKDGNAIFLVDAEPESSKDYSAPGDIYKYASPEYLEDIRKGRATVYPVHKDSWGAWVTGAGYIHDKNGKVLAQLGMDVDASDWNAEVRQYRAFGIFVTFVTCMLGFASYLVWLRNRQASERDAVIKVAVQRLSGEKKLQALTGAQGEGVIVQEATGGVSFVNPEACRLLGYTEDELTGSTLYGLLKCRDNDYKTIPEDSFAASLTLSQGGPVRVDGGFFIKKDGSMFPVSYVSSPIMEDGATTGVVLAFQDISERRRLEKQNHDFYAMITHDLKSPVSIISGYAEMLAIEKSGMLDDDAKIMVGSIRSSCGKLQSLITDYLTLSRFESGHLVLNESSEDILETVGETCFSLSAIAANKDLAVRTSFQGDMPHVLLDKPQIQRALNNLLVNAINYTPHGGSITVATSVIPSGNERFIAISVSDSGPGIPAGDEERIFEKYYRCQNTSGVKGNGLGLAIVRAVATAHGGYVVLDNSAAEGATFTLTIPLKTTSSSTSQA